MCNFLYFFLTLPFFPLPIIIEIIAYNIRKCALSKYLCALNKYICNICTQLMGMTQPCIQRAAITLPFEQLSQTPLVHAAVASFFQSIKFQSVVCHRRWAATAIKKLFAHFNLRRHIGQKFKILSEMLLQHVGHKKSNQKSKRRKETSLYCQNCNGSLSPGVGIWMP